LPYSKSLAKIKKNKKMARTVTKYSIFLGSPSDLEEERFAIEEVIKELNLSFGAPNNLIIELVKWETHSAPGISNQYTQDLINKDIGDEYDIFIGLLWKKFGTKTENAKSGTEEEFMRAFNRFQNNPNSLQVMFYFKQAVPKSMKELNANELLKIENFKTTLSEKKVLYWDFDSFENLKTQLRLHIPKRINNLIENNSKTNNTKDLIELEEKVDELGFLDYSEMYTSSLSESTISITRIGEATEWMGVEMSKKTDEITRISRMTNPNKIVIKEVIKRVAKLMNDYNQRIELDIPIYYSSFQEAINAGSNLINLADDFYTDKTIIELEETKDSIFDLKTGITNGLNGINSLFESIKELPRIQKDINIAKRNLLSSLGDLIGKLEQSLILSEEFSSQIGTKIDKLRLKV
jgi:Domain of unknown function (DUF4062)